MTTVKNKDREELKKDSKMFAVKTTRAHSSRSECFFICEYYYNSLGETWAEFEKNRIDQIVKLTKEDKCVVEKILQAAYKVSNPIYGVGRLIRNRRTELSMSINELAEKTKLDKGYLSRLERGMILRPGIEALISIANAVKIDPDMILSMSGYTAGSELQDNLKNPIIMKDMSETAINESDLEMIDSAVRSAKSAKKHDKDAQLLYEAAQESLNTAKSAKRHNSRS